MTTVPVAVVGVGHLGKEHARILASLDGVALVGVVDPDREQAEAVARRCRTRAFADHRAVIGRAAAAVVAAPTGLHHAVASELLAAGVHLLVEKPLAATPDQADEMVRLAEAGRLVLQVGHVERFNPAFEELQSRPLRPRYVFAERCSGFTGRSTDVGVVLDLMIHDLDLVLALTGAAVARVEAMGVAVLGGHEDVAHARLTFVDGGVADLTASRIHPEPTRRMRLWGAEGWAGVDFARKRLTLAQPAEHLRRAAIDSRRLDPALATSLKAQLYGRHIETCELDCAGRHQADQLTRELEEFVGCVRTGRSPRVDGAAGRHAIEVAARILSAIHEHAWEGDRDGPCGPHGLPPPRGRLFVPAAAAEAA